MITTTLTHNSADERSRRAQLSIEGMHYTPYPYLAKPLTKLEDQTVPFEDNEKYPDGGRTAWLVVVGAWCAMVPSMGLLNTLAILQAWLMEHDLHGVPESKVGWIFSCYAFFLYFCGAQVGKSPVGCFLHMC